MIMILDLPLTIILLDKQCMDLRSMQAQQCMDFQSVQALISLSQYWG